MKALKNIIRDIKNTSYHKTWKCLVHIQATYKDGRVWILKSNGESLTTQKEELQGTTTKFKLAKYIQAKLQIFDVDQLCEISLEKLAKDYLDKEDDVDSAFEFAEMVGINLFEEV